ncbi:AbiH family protein [Carnobacterium maltaromaticum]|uniref:AbiH family protein n=1 Tax=Carnobacterium maltaromaticum TaxID=2751 RepID=UPI0039AF10F8
MEITFFVGNGFDIKNGMKTKYSDFYDYVRNDKKMRNAKANNLIYDSIEEDIEKWSNFEVALGELTKDIKMGEKQMFIDSILELRSDFREYLILEEKKINMDNPEIVNSLKETMKNFYTDLKKTEKDKFISIINQHRMANNKYNFINFNYTSLLKESLDIFGNAHVEERYLDRTNYQDTLREYIDIHGTYDDGMLLGVNDISQIKPDIYDDVEKSLLIKPEMNAALRNGKSEDAQLVINRSKIIIIYGMSLGKTDAVWWKEIINWLIDSEERMLIIHSYNQNVNLHNTYMYLKYRDAEIENFMSYGEDLDDKIKEKIKDRIFICFNSESSFNLQFKKIDEE